ncbi:DUF4430 domain-containing protein [Enterococcus xiangfangensis]|uniref:DUF4430 domain-containing protein n=1 Tax=Enterococcus xiangfangensis TaxID=1296537 RepID=A0ABU3F9J3_9ENTE|nr:DUF4430 domain-containing protein [Enterococcus xiangfangensis]MDT2759345.1 DUF4430 domain-containing protein [Enterococcus xiangfangensis]
MKKLLNCLLLITAIITLGACGSAQAKEQKKVSPLTTETQLPKNGVITKARMKTIVGKKQAYNFIGENQKIKYRWIYQGQQIQNPVKQKLKLRFKTQGLEQVKKAANNANESIGFSISKMELAGTPELQLTIPKQWQANKAYLVGDIKGKLKKVTGSPVTMKNSGEQTILSFRVLESNVDYYIVAGGTKIVEDTSGATKTGLNEASQDNSTQRTQQDNSFQQSLEGNEGQPTENSENIQANDGATKTETENLKGTINQVQEGAKSTQPVPKATVTFSISAKAVLANWSDLAKEKQPYVPKDGWILPPTQVSLKSGDSVYDLLVRVTKERGIQMESNWTPMYNAYYISGIHQLYEFDCGNLSGWMYQVNGWFPNYGSSKYKDLHGGDEIKWEYTCDLGHDIGNNSK